MAGPPAISVGQGEIPLVIADLHPCAQGASLLAGAVSEPVFAGMKHGKDAPCLNVVKSVVGDSLSALRIQGGDGNALFAVGGVDVHIFSCLQGLVDADLLAGVQIEDIGLDSRAVKADLHGGICVSAVEDGHLQSVLGEDQLVVCIPQKVVAIDLARLLNAEHLGLDHLFDVGVSRCELECDGADGPALALRISGVALDTAGRQVVLADGAGKGVPLLDFQPELLAGRVVIGWRIPLACKARKPGEEGAADLFRCACLLCHPLLRGPVGQDVKLDGDGTGKIPARAKEDAVLQIAGRGGVFGLPKAQPLNGQDGSQLQGIPAVGQKDTSLFQWMMFPPFLLIGRSVGLDLLARFGWTI